MRTKTKPLACLLAFVGAFSIATAADAVTIDSFEVGQHSLEDASSASGSVTDTATGPTSDILGGVRELTIELGSGASVRGDLNPDLPDLFDDGLAFTVAPGSQGVLRLLYGGVTPLRVDLSADGHSVLAFRFDSDVAAMLEVELDDGINSGTQATTTTGGSGLYKNLPLEFFATVDLTSIQRILLSFAVDNSAGLDPVTLRLNDVSTAVPEPGTLSLVAIGLLVLACRRESAG